jgi:hypothetical protein
MRATDAIADIGAAHYFDPATLEVGKANNLDGFRFYFLGRGGVLGDVEPAVVASAFGYFNPALVEKMWGTAKERVDPREAARLYLGCAHELARSRFGGADLGAFCEAAEAIVRAIEPAGLALFAGYLAEPLPEDAPARAMQLCVTIREGRGSAHLLAVRAAGLSPRQAHQIKRPTELATFGWDGEVALTAEHRSAWERAEELTDQLLEPAWASLDESGRTAMTEGLATISTALKPA